MIDFNLKDIREKILKLTQSQFAKMLGVRQDYISRLERNANNITLDLLDKLAENTGLSIDELTKYKKNSFEDEDFDLYNDLLNIQNIADKLSEEISSVDKKNNDKITELLSNVYNQINETFDIVVYGRYSSGKTSFIIREVDVSDVYEYPEYYYTRRMQFTENNTSIEYTLNCPSNVSGIISLIFGSGFGIYTLIDAEHNWYTPYSISTVDLPNAEFTIIDGQVDSLSFEFNGNSNTNYFIRSAQDTNLDLIMSLSDFTIESTLSL